MVDSTNAKEVTAAYMLMRLKRVVDSQIFWGGGEHGSFEEPTTGDDICDVPDYKGRVRAAKACRKAANELLYYIKTAYRRELHIKVNGLLPAWIYKQKGILDALDKTRFEDVYSYIVKHTLSMKEEIEISLKLNLPQYKTRIKSGINQGKKVAWEYVLFRPDYQDMTNTLHIEKITLQKYIQGFCKLGILKKLKKEGSRGSFIYAAGYYSVFSKDGNTMTKRNLLLKENPKTKKALRGYKVSSK